VRSNHVARVPLVAGQFPELENLLLAPRLSR
jgi:hypothetical protein